MNEYQKYLNELFGIGKKENPTVEEVYRIIFDWGKENFWYQYGDGRRPIIKKLMSDLNIDASQAGEIEGIILNSYKKVFQENRERLFRPDVKVDAVPDSYTPLNTRILFYGFIDNKVRGDKDAASFADVMWFEDTPKELKNDIIQKVKSQSYDEIQEVLNR